jgi:Ankyrin repeat
VNSELIALLPAPLKYHDLQDGRTALHLMAEMGSAINLLLAAPGVDVNIQDKVTSPHAASLIMSYVLL